MRYSEDIIQEVMALNDVVDVVSSYVALNPRSGNHFGRCPFHNEKTASFSVSQTKQIFYCFGCNAGGNVINFIMRIENLDFIASIKLLADRVGFKLPEKTETASAKEERTIRERSAELNKIAARFYHDYLYGSTNDAKNARRYLEERGISAGIIKRFGLGLSPTAWDGLLKHMDTEPSHLVAAGLATQGRNDAAKYYDRFRSRLMFPIIDSRNRVVGFGGRIMAESDKLEDSGRQESRSEAKYLNTPETSLFHKSSQLYGLNLARKARKPDLIIVEGYMDVLAMHQWGFTNTVAVLGTALNESHVRLLKSFSDVILMLDGDAAGVRATLRAIPILTAGGLKVKTLNLSEISEADATVKDPDEYLKKHGSVPMVELIKNAKSHIAFQVALYKQNYDMSTTDGRIGFTQEAAKLLSTLSSAIETDAYISEISKTSEISEAAIRTEVNKQKGVAPSAIPISRTRVRSTKGDGVKKARNTLLHLILTYHIAAKALEESKYIGTLEIGSAIYSELLNLAFSNAAQGKQMNPAEIIAHFEDQAITEIFIDTPEYSTKLAIEKTLNETAFIVKRAWALQEMESESARNDPKTLQLLGLTIRTMPSISI